MMEQTWMWIGFNVFVLTMFAVDLFVFTRKRTRSMCGRPPRGASSGSPSPCYSGAASMRSWDARPASSTSAGYVIEKSLSVDNIFVFVLIFCVLPRTGALPAPRPVLGRCSGRS